MKRTVIQFILFLAISLIGVGCQDNDHKVASTENVEANTTATLSTGKPESQGHSDDSIIAKVDDTVITFAEVEKELKNFMAQYQNSMPPEQFQMMRSKMRKQTIENLINKQLLFHEADRKKIKPSLDETNAELARISNIFPSPEDFQQALPKMGISREQLLKDIEQQLKINILMKEALSGVPTVTEDELIAFYQENPENFRASEQVSARHILLKCNPEDASDVKDKKRLELADLRNQIENGADFSKIAMTYSEGPSKEQGGDLGFFGRGQMVKPFEDAAFSLNKGEMSDIIETQFGFHLIKVVDQKEARTIPLEEVRDNIAAQLQERKEQQAFTAYLEKLRRDARIEYSESG